MSKNIVSFTLTNDQIAAIDNAVGGLENQLQDLLSLTIHERRGLAKMGTKSEAFCRQTINALNLYPQIASPSIGVDRANTNVSLLDQMRPIFQRLHHLSERSADTELAIGSDIMGAALKGYRALKAFGRGEGLETLRRQLGERRFNAKSARPAPVVPAAG
jgi:hypothetical protein